MSEKTLEEEIRELLEDFEADCTTNEILSLVVARLEKVKNSIIACDRDCMVSVVDTCIQAIRGG